MKIEKSCYIVVKEEDDKIMYLTETDTFIDDIGGAVKSANRITANFLIGAYKESKWWNDEITDEEYRDENCTFEMKVVPLKITYEW